MNGPQSRAHVEFDPAFMGVRIAVLREGGGRREVMQWPTPTIRTIEENVGTEIDADWLRITDDDARALYEALADYFGHAGHDTRALRKDYDAERARVDKFIRHLTGGTP